MNSIGCPSNLMDIVAVIFNAVIHNNYQVFWVIELIQAFRVLLKKNL